VIDEYDKNYFLLSCDICGITEEGPFATFTEAVEYKKDHPEEWKSLFLKNEQDGKYKWHDVCMGCFPKTPMAKWKYIPASKRRSPEKKVDETLTNMANSIAKTITKRKNAL
jgi:hypothetical protein